MNKWINIYSKSFLFTLLILRTYIHSEWPYFHRECKKNHNQINRINNSLKQSKQTYISTLTFNRFKYEKSHKAIKIG